MTDDRVLDSQRPVWKEQWCARKDAVESSGGKEDQFWATGVSESLPPPSLPHSSHRRPHLADHDGPQRAHSNRPFLIPNSSTSTTRQSRMGTDHANTMPTSSRRKPNLNLSHLRSQPPPSVRIHKLHAHVPNRDLVRPTRSAGPYSAKFPTTGDGRVHKRARREDMSPFSGEWSQLKARSGSSTNPGYDFEQSFEDLHLFSSRSVPQMPAVAPSYPMHTSVASADPSLSASRSLFSSPVSSQRMNSSSTHMDYAGSKGHSRPPEASFHTAPHVQESGQHGSFFGPGDVSYDDFWPYASSALHEGDGSFSWPGDQGSRQMDHFPPAVHSAARPAYGDLPPLPNTPAHDPSFAQFAQPSSQQYATSLSNERSPSFSLNNDLYGSPEDFHAAHQFTDLNITPTTLPGMEGMSLESFPNIVEDENGTFHIE